MRAASVCSCGYPPSCSKRVCVCVCVSMVKHPKGGADKMFVMPHVCTYVLFRLRLPSRDSPSCWNVPSPSSIVHHLCEGFVTGTPRVFTGTPKRKPSLVSLRHRCSKCAVHRIKKCMMYVESRVCVHLRVCVFLQCLIAEVKDPKKMQDRLGGAGWPTRKRGDLRHLAVYRKSCTRSAVVSDWHTL